jgi:predicted enzyme related to lactoylglutathione lyase
MPNPVVSFEIRGPDPARLRQFYADAFGWEAFVFPGGDYAGIETEQHTHDESSGTVTYTGEDANMNSGVVIGSVYGQPAWKYQGESNWRSFVPGVAGGIGRGDSAVRFYIQVADLRAALDAVSKAGGREVMAPTEVAPNVSIATFSDPAGNVLGLSRAPAKASPAAATQ